MVPSGSTMMYVLQLVLLIKGMSQNKQHTQEINHVALSESIIKLTS